MTQPLFCLSGSEFPNHGTSCCHLSQDCDDLFLHMCYYHFLKKKKLLLFIIIFCLCIVSVTLLLEAPINFCFFPSTFLLEFIALVIVFSFPKHFKHFFLFLFYLL